MRGTGLGVHWTSEEIDMDGPVPMQRRKFAVQLSTGNKDVGKVKSALMFATIAQCSAATRSSTACKTERRGHQREDQEEERAARHRDVRTASRGCAAVGAKFQLCQQVAVNRSLTKEDLIEGTRSSAGST
jgi:predicted peroxiredoxin